MGNCLCANDTSPAPPAGSGRRGTGAARGGTAARYEVAEASPASEAASAGVAPAVLLSPARPSELSDLQLFSDDDGGRGSAAVSRAAWDSEDVEVYLSAHERIGPARGACAGGATMQEWAARLGAAMDGPCCKMRRGAPAAPRVLVPLAVHGPAAAPFADGVGTCKQRGSVPAPRDGSRP
jgi:hypothetical protein